MQTNLIKVHPAIAVDVGGVLCDDWDTLDSEGNREFAPPIDGAFEGVRRLIELFDGEVYISSKAGPRIQERTRSWLDHYRFFQVTGFNPGYVHFVSKREEKVDLSLNLGITHQIDDRVDVLDLLWGNVKNLYLFRTMAQAQQTNENVPKWCREFHEWGTMVDAITIDLGSRVYDE